MGKTRAEEREERLRRQAKRQAEQAKWEASEERQKYLARQAKRASAREEKLAKEASKEQAKHEDWECSSQTTASTAITWVTLTPEVEEEVQCKVEADKDVRRLAKKLREMVKLEACNSLDPLQKAKLEKKHDLEVELGSTRGLARARALNELNVRR